MKSFDTSLYLVTDPHMAKSGVEDTVERALKGGVTLVQLREKEGDTGELYQKAMRLKAVTDAYRVPLIIDDRIDVMLAVDAAGVHVGQSDMPAAIARKLIGPDKILGVSAGTLEEAVQAEKDGADYLGVGAVFPTQTKKDADPVSAEILKEIIRTVSIPVVAIGGIKKENIPLLKDLGLAGVAVVSAVMAAEDPEKEAKELRYLVSETEFKKFRKNC